MARTKQTVSSPGSDIFFSDTLHRLENPFAERHLVCHLRQKLKNALEQLVVVSERLPLGPDLG